MKVRTQKRGLSPPVVTEDIQSIVIYDQHGNPIFVAQQLEPGMIITEKAGSPSFEKMLKNLGIGLNTAYRVVKK